MTYTACSDLPTAWARLICRRYCTGTITAVQVQAFVPTYITQEICDWIVAYDCGNES